MSVAFGLAVENFTPQEREPSMDEMVGYATRAEQLGFRSLWAWDHLFLGARRPFPFHESLTTLTVLAAHTRHVQLGTGVLVLPIRDPVLLAKVTATLQTASGGRLLLGMAAGWYEREFDAAGVPFKGRGRIFERNLEILHRLWGEDGVTGEYDQTRLRNVRMLPLPQPRPKVLIGGYVDRVLKRVATRGDGWITYFYTAESFSQAWAKIRDFAEEAGRDPDELSNVAQLPLCIADSYEEADRLVRRYVDDYFDMAPWSESTADSAIRGTPEQCAEQLAAQLEAGVQHAVFAPFDYRLEQIERFAAEVWPLLQSAPAGSVR
ncbi:alkanesulfonate monooxygenase [Saccharopolyspora erythraea NRRL 2338]|uniref:Alkanesulfonate monooxygenase n=2 Tax=Saccharopolyspora erythraea TaxID=1836 RepID=A4FJB9_SACEN|nr:TIGR03619 family F420-dependent LLM class oxidoreductase [Saccharopolyspora erythraea]EQD85375.1 luciferase [Saccharopolyspora erythraea D]PFG97813.1 alkanesulfonate monooxygenase [Saccharopolyspora erythraea NRRL 2338]QRK87952.1 TIGR03619 family F420-dependent LLM class oxidoreductase [Saccharopolyspora erythraea]CAM04144.1 putative alkanesulfonate monooxygenase [Saccharopolyspora erythraea NRRL 2338]